MSYFADRSRPKIKLFHQRQLSDPLVSSPGSWKLKLQVSSPVFRTESKLKDLDVDTGNQQYRKDDFIRIYQELNSRINQRADLSKRLQKINMQIKENEERISALEHDLGLKPVAKKHGRESRSLSPVEVIFRRNVTQRTPIIRKSNVNNSFESELRDKLRDFVLTPTSISQGTITEFELLENDRQMIVFSIMHRNSKMEKAAQLMADLFQQLGDHITTIIPNKNDIEKVDKEGNVGIDRIKGMDKWMWAFQQTLDKFMKNEESIPGMILFFIEGYSFKQCNTQLWEIREVAKRNLLGNIRLIVFDEARPIEPQLTTLWQTKTNYLTIGYPLNFFLFDKKEGTKALWSRIEMFFKTTDFCVGDTVEAKHKNATGFQLATVQKVHRGNKEFDINYDDSKTLKEIWGPRAGRRLRCPRDEIKPKVTNVLVALACSQPMIFTAQNNLHVTMKCLIKWSKSNLSSDYININCTNEDGNTPLHIACQTGNVEVMRVLLENNANPVIKNDKDMTCLVLAAAHGNKAVVEELLVKIASYPFANKPNLSHALTMAAAKGQLSTAATLVKHKADVNAVDDGGRSALLFAAREGHEEMCKYLIALGADFEHSDKYGQTALIWASAEGHLEVIAVLLEAEANVEAEDNEGQTPLIWAASEGFQEICEMLLEYGAKIESVDAEYGRSPLMRAAMESNFDTILLLVEYNADLESRDYDGRTAFMLAAEFSEPRILLNLVDDLKADVNAQDNNARTALVESAKNGELETVTLLLKAKADVSKRDKFGWNALMWAAKRGSVDVLECLLLANPEEVNSEIRGVTALMRAAAEGHTKAVKLLSKHKADCEVRDHSENQTALMKAAQGGYEDTVAELLMVGADATAKDDNEETAIMLARNRSLGNVVMMLEEFKKFSGMTSISEQSENKYKIPFLLAPEIKNKKYLPPTSLGRGHRHGSSSQFSSSGGSVITVIDQIKADLRKGKGKHPRSSIIWI